MTLCFGKLQFLEGKQFDDANQTNQTNQLEQKDCGLFEVVWLSTLL